MPRPENPQSGAILPVTPDGVGTVVKLFGDAYRRYLAHGPLDFGCYDQSTSDLRRQRGDSSRKEARSLETILDMLGQERLAERLKVTIADELATQLGVH